MKIQNNKGITLVETIVTVAVSTMLLLALVSLWFNTSRFDTRTSYEENVFIQGEKILNELERGLRSADTLSEPSSLSTSNELRYTVDGVETHVRLTGGVIERNQGSGWSPMTFVPVTADSFEVENYSSGVGTVRIRMTLETEVQEVEYSRDFTQTVMLRR